MLRVATTAQCSGIATPVHVLYLELVFTAMAKARAGVCHTINWSLGLGQKLGLVCTSYCERVFRPRARPKVRLNQCNQTMLMMTS